MGYIIKNRQDDKISNIILYERLIIANLIDSITFYEGK